MWWKELSLDEANEYLLTVFKSLLEFGEFRRFVDSNYVIRQYLDPDTGDLVKIDILTKEEANDHYLPKKCGETLH